MYGLLADKLYLCSVLTPSQIIEEAYGIGERKVAMTRNNSLRLFVASLMAGCFIALGGVLSLTGSASFTVEGNVSAAKIVAGALFPVGLILVVMMGAELFTGNNALLVPAFMRRRYSISDVIKNWTIVYIGNFIGTVFFTWLFVYCCGITSAEPFNSVAVAIAQNKVSPSWLTVFLKGVAANWCVCLAIWLALSSKNFPAKALGCWLPVMTFVVLGYEHCIANMFYLTIGLLEGADVTVLQCLWRNLVPSTLGNIIGGALFVGTLHTWLHASQK